MGDTPLTDALRHGSTFTYPHRARELCEQLERALATAREAALEDAERYRWLRECTGPVCAGIADSDPTQWLDTTDLDAAIDAARGRK